jgi:hypothetical protein
MGLHNKIGPRDWFEARAPGFASSVGPVTPLCPALDISLMAAGLDDLPAMNGLTLLWEQG